MLITLGMFMFNLLCGLVPCDPKFDSPEINRNPFFEIGSRSSFGKSVEKVDIPAIVTVRQGKIEGYHMKTSSARTIFAFEGIPYGRAERWKPPVPREPWIGTLHAKKPGSDCLQLSMAKMLRVHGSEDCLFLNVFTPDLPSKEDKLNFPVVIYIHGGSFMMGAGAEHGPSYLLNNEVVLVTINYRLGVLGFLSTGDNVIPGNFGLKDQALAIQWVHSNIAQFGGNPKNITLWGYSAGGASVHMHMMSNVTKHLFQRGISMGGSAFQHWALMPGWRQRQFTDKIARRFGCPTDSSEALASCLSKLSPYHVVGAQMFTFDWFPFPGCLFAPTVEPEHDGAFITFTVEEAYEEKHIDPKPWILTTTKDEGITAVLVLELLLRWMPFKLSWRSTAKHYLDYDYISSNPDEITEKVTQFYLGDKSPMAGTAFEYSDMLTDRYFHFGIRNSWQAHSLIAPTYAGYFKFHRGKYSLGNFFSHRSYEWGIGHGEDDYYYFNCSTQYPGFQENDPEYKLSKMLINFLYNFVSTGKPTYIEDGEELDPWEPIYNVANIKMLQIDEEIKMIPISDDNKKRLKFWQQLNLTDMVPWIQTEG